MLNNDYGNGGISSGIDTSGLGCLYACTSVYLVFGSSIKGMKRPGIGRNIRKSIKPTENLCKAIKNFHV